MSDRISQLARRRRELILRSARLRGELATDHRVIEETLAGFEKMVGTARRILQPALLVGGGALALRLLRRRLVRKVRPVGFAMRVVGWVTLARRALTVLTLVRAVARARRGREAESPF